MKRPLLITACTVVLLLIIIILIVPAKKNNSFNDYTNFAKSDLKEIIYSGEFKESNGTAGKIRYLVNLDSGEIWQQQAAPFYKVTELSLASEDLLKRTVSFWGSSMTRTQIQDLLKLEVSDSFPYSETKKQKYGFEGCLSSITIVFAKKNKKYCIGDENFGSTKKYILDVESNLVLLAHNHVISRWQKNPLVFKAPDLLPLEQKYLRQIRLELGEELQFNNRNLLQRFGNTILLNHEYKVEENPQKRIISRWSFQKKQPGSAESDSLAQNLKEKFWALELIPILEPAEGDFFVNAVLIFKSDILSQPENSNQSGPINFKLNLWKKKFSYLDLYSARKEQSEFVVEIQLNATNQKLYFSPNRNKISALISEFSRIDSALQASVNNPKQK